MTNDDVWYQAWAQLDPDYAKEATNAGRKEIIEEIALTMAKALAENIFNNFPDCPKQISLEIIDTVKDNTRNIIASIRQKEQPK